MGDLLIHDTKSKPAVTFNFCTHTNPRLICETMKRKHNNNHTKIKKIRKTRKEKRNKFPVMLNPISIKKDCGRIVFWTLAADLSNIQQHTWTTVKWKMRKEQFEIGTYFPWPHKKKNLCAYWENKSADVKLHFLQQVLQPQSSLVVSWLKISEI